MNPERLHSINKITGKHPENISKFFENEFMTAKVYEHDERDKTPEENEIIKSIIERINEFLKNYGAKSLNLENRHVHILDKTKMSKETFEFLEKEYPESNGFYIKEKQAIVVLGWKIISLLDLARVIAHELIHFLSFNSVVTDKEGQSFVSHKTGLLAQSAKF